MFGWDRRDPKPRSMKYEDKDGDYLIGWGMGDRRVGMHFK